MLDANAGVVLNLPAGTMATKLLNPSRAKDGIGTQAPTTAAAEASRSQYSKTSVTSGFGERVYRSFPAMHWGLDEARGCC